MKALPFPCSATTATAMIAKQPADQPGRRSLDRDLECLVAHRPMRGDNPADDDHRVDHRQQGDHRHRLGGEPGHRRQHRRGDREILRAEEYPGDVDQHVGQDAQREDRAGPGVQPRIAPQPRSTAR